MKTENQCEFYKSGPRKLKISNSGDYCASTDCVNAVKSHLNLCILVIKKQAAWKKTLKHGLRNAQKPIPRGAKKIFDRS
jgi:hypothetical protein